VYEADELEQADMTGSVLIYRLGSMGDMVVALPCFHKVMASFPDARRVLLTNIPISSKAAPSQSVLGRGALFDDSIVYPLGLRSPLGLWRLVRQIRHHRPETLIYLMPARGAGSTWRDRLFFRLCGIRRVIGLPYSIDLQRNRIDPLTGSEEPECERLARTLSALGPIDLSSRHSWNMLLTDAEQARGRDAIAPFAGRPFFAFNMGGKARTKDWGLTRWLALLDRLAAAYPGHGFLVVGAAEDAAFAGIIAQRFPGRVVDACARLSPRECAAALSHAALFVGHDSGPLHLAAANGVTCVGLFGAFNRPRIWHPYGPSHRVIHRLDGMAAISVDEVAHTISEAMARSVASSIV
jgi:heptosyltransferase III